MANFVVNSTADTVTGPCDLADCTLREALTDARLNAEADTITFAPALAGQTLQTIAKSSNLGFGPTALVISGDDITIDGSAAPQLQINGNGALRIFAVGANGKLTLKNVTVTGGTAEGGKGGDALSSGGGGGAAGLGGAIFNRGTLNVVQSTLKGNIARGGNGGTSMGILSNCGGGGGRVGGNGGNCLGLPAYAGGGGVAGPGQNTGVSSGAGGANENLVMAPAGISGTLGGGGGGATGHLDPPGNGLGVSSGGFGGRGGGSGGSQALAALAVMPPAVAVCHSPLAPMPAEPEALAAAEAAGAAFQGGLAGSEPVQAELFLRAAPAGPGPGWAGPSSTRAAASR